MKKKTESNEPEAALLLLAEWKLFSTFFYGHFIPNCDIDGPRYLVPSMTMNMCCFILIFSVTIMIMVYSCGCSFYLLIIFRNGTFRSEFATTN